MKRLFKFFTVAAIIAVGFTGCSSETPIEGGSEGSGSGTDGKTARGSETYATFRFVADGATTKASALGTDIVANETSLPFDSLRLTIYDADGIKELDTLVKTPGNNITLKLTSGYKQLYILSNETTRLKSVLSAPSISSSFNGIYSLDGTANSVADLDYIGDLYNPQIVSNTTLATDAGITLAGNITEADAISGNQNNIPMIVQRSVAKVFISQTPAIPIAEGGTGKVITQDSMVIISNSTNSPKTPTFQLWNVLAYHKPYQDVSGTQVLSPYYDAPAGYTWESIYARNITPAFTDATAVTIAENPVPAIGAAYYITENVPQIPRIGNSTYAAIKAIATPTRLHYISGLSFSELNGGLFTGTKATSDAPTAQTFYVLNPQGLSTTAVGLTGKQVFAGTDALALARKALYHLLNPTVAQLPGGLVAYNDASITTALGANWDLYVDTYTDGVVYYRLNIGSKVGSTLKPEVLRNKFYKMNIESYKTVGAATVGELLDNPDEEITSETYLNVTITITGWEDVSNDQDI
ncbi:MAG: fimbria major subunit [Tannerellaceae bacterium]|jgi:hypothetical protein|nr:fimbria major subunit [Tannerellaceae bacterium]